MVIYFKNAAEEADDLEQLEVGLREAKDLPSIMLHFRHAMMELGEEETQRISSLISLKTSSIEDIRREIVEAFTKMLPGRRQELARQALDEKEEQLTRRRTVLKWAMEKTDTIAAIEDKSGLNDVFYGIISHFEGLDEVESVAKLKEALRLEDWKTAERDLPVFLRELEQAMGNQISV